MQTIYVPKYKLHYRVNPKDSMELQWSKKPFGPATQWQHAMSFRKPIRALDIDDATQQGVVVLNDSSTYVGSGVRKWGRKFYPAGTRIFSLYAVGESKEKDMKKCSMQKKMEAYREIGDPKTRVYFCYIVEKDGDIENTAVFIDEVNKRNGMVTVYTHNDQHSEASIEWVAQCKPIANPAETEILKELTDRMGYDIKAVGKAVAFRELGIN